MTRFVKGSVLQEASTALKLTSLDIEKDNVNYKQVDVGYAADRKRKQLHAVPATGKTSQKMLREFRMVCKEVLNKASKLLLEKCPLKYSLVRNLVCFDPREIVRDLDRRL